MSPDVDILDDLQAGTEVPRDFEADAVLREEMDAKVRAAIEHDKQDPRQQRYMRNATTGKLIRTAEQYHRMVENKQGFVSITYNQALELHKAEEGVKRRALADALKKKRARKARKGNRG